MPGLASADGISGRMLEPHEYLLIKIVLFSSSPLSEEAPMIELLKRIHEGQHEFTPKSEGASAEDFNFIANQLFQAEEDGLIVILKTHRESETRHSYYDVILVEGLTVAGTDFLGDV